MGTRMSTSKRKVRRREEAFVRVSFSLHLCVEVDSNLDYRVT